MFYFIGGAPRTGKTILSKKLSTTLGLPWISVDTMESIVMEYISDSDFSKRFPKSVLRKQTGHSNDEMYTRYSTSEIVDAYKEQAQATWKAVRMFVSCENTYRHDYILEGHQLHPALLASLDLQESRIVFLGREDVATTASSASCFAGAHDWFAEKTENPETYEKVAKMIVEYSRYLKQEAEKYGYKYVNLDDNFEKTQREIVEHLI